MDKFIMILDGEERHVEVSDEDGRRVVHINGFDGDFHITPDGTPSERLSRLLDRCDDDRGLMRLGVPKPLEFSTSDGYTWTITTRRVEGIPIAVDRVVVDGMGNEWSYSNPYRYWMNYPGTSYPDNLKGWTSDALYRWINSLPPAALAAVEDYLRAVVESRGS